jgi:hypothetical protein
MARKLSAEELEVVQELTGLKVPDSDQESLYRSFLSSILKKLENGEIDDEIAYKLIKAFFNSCFIYNMKDEKGKTQKYSQAILYKGVEFMSWGYATYQTRDQVIRSTAVITSLKTLFFDQKLKAVRKKWTIDELVDEGYLDYDNLDINVINVVERYYPDNSEEVCVQVEGKASLKVFLKNTIKLIEVIDRLDT